MGVRYEALMPPHLKCSLICCSCTRHSTVKCTSTIQPATETPYPQVSQVSGIDLPVFQTGITAFSEDYHGPAAPLRHTAVQVDLRVVNRRAGLAHRQSIHILRHCRHKHPKAQMSDFNRWFIGTWPTCPPGIPHPKSAHPDVQVHQ